MSCKHGVVSDFVFNCAFCNNEKIKELEAKLEKAVKTAENYRTYKSELADKLAIAVEALCHLENATDSHSVQRNDEWNKLINEALEKIKQ